MTVYLVIKSIGFEYDRKSIRKGWIIMKLDFLIRNINRDLNLITRVDGDKVSLYDVKTVIKRWEQALVDENTLKEAEQRFQELLLKEAFRDTDYIEAIDLLMFIHRPLINGRNDV